jgi:hypothetical protein
VRMPYRNGVDLHLDLATSRFVPRQLNSGWARMVGK